jgi:hypothetical protein
MIRAEGLARFIRPWVIPAGQREHRAAMSLPVLYVVNWSSTNSRIFTVN